MKNFLFSAVLIGTLALVVGGCGSVTNSPDTSVSNDTMTSDQNVMVDEGNTENTDTTMPASDSADTTKTDVQVDAMTDVVYNMAEVGKHNTENDCWLVIDAKVYDVTSYIPHHPGGPETIISSCGKEATKLFDLKHKPETKALLADYFVADLGE